MSEVEDDTMDSCDGPILQIGERNTVNYSPCSVDLDYATESPVSEQGEPMSLNEENLQPQEEMVLRFDEEIGNDILRQEVKSNSFACTKNRQQVEDDIVISDGGIREEKAGKEMKLKCDDENVPAQSSCEDIGVQMDRQTSITSSDFHTTQATDSDDCKRLSETESLSGAGRVDCEAEVSDEGALQQPLRQIYMIGKHNVLNLNIYGKREESLSMEGKTEVQIKYKLNVDRATSDPSTKRTKTRIVIDIESCPSAVDAAFVAMHRPPVRSKLDTLFSAIGHIIDLIVPGSIIMEIKPTSENSIRTLLESINNGQFDSIVKEILSQESVFNQIKGKKVTVTVELNIPEELLQKEGIVVIDNAESSQIVTGTDLAVTLKEQDTDDDNSSQSSSVDPPDILSAEADLSSSVDPTPQQSARAAAPQPTSPVSGQSLTSFSSMPSASKGHSASSSHTVKKRSYQNLTICSLEKMSKQDPAEVLMELNKKKRELQQILNKKMSSRTAHIITDVLGKASQCDSMSQWVNELLTTILQTSFMRETFGDFLGQKDDSDADLRLVIGNVLPLLRQVLQRMPTEGWTQVQCIAFLIHSKWLRSTQVDANIIKDIESLFELLKVTKPQASASLGLQTGMDDDDGFETPPENYRKLPIIPLKEELNGSMDIFLLPNKIGKKFNDLEHYLECQFRLFRADVILPLKQNIQDFRTMREKTSTSYRVYSDVQILRPVCSENGLGYRIAFDPRPLRRVKWDTSQRLIFGSLLCLSSDNFIDSMLFATVDKRETESLKKGLVDVQFLSDDLDIATLTRDLRFDMVESPAYFESYKDILKGMQTLNDRTLPFQEYIVECQSKVAEPAYSKYLQYDLRPLIDHDYKITDDEGDQTFSPEIGVATNIQIRDKQAWPSIDDLDSSQLKAIQNALTREFALIQGPPGTGKTYVGIKLLKVLLHNSQVWLQGQPRIPILVVCYTNHALDQFLEGILSTFNGKLLRVGGRIKSELLKRYSLNNERKAVKDKRAVPFHLHEARMVTQRAMNKLKGKIHRIADKIEAAEREIIHESFLKEFMTAERFVSSKRSSSISLWLGIEQQIAELDQDNQNPEDVLLEMEQEDEDEDDTTDIIDSQENRFSQRRLEEDTLDIFLDSDSDDFRDVAGKSRSDDKMAYIAVNVTRMDDNNESIFIPRSQREAYREKVKRKRRLKMYLMKEICSRDRMTASEENKVSDIWKLKYKDRWRLYRHWVDLFSSTARQEIKSMEEEYKCEAAKFKEILMQEDRVILEGCSVIGMTTTGAARYQKILNEIGPKIILVEEAAEVLEAHIIGTLSRRCQHLILIGDHKQLRPNPTVHELAKKYNLEISLFERMVKSGIHCDMLEWQHRMRPEIADTVRSLYQGQLKDHDVVSRYGNVKGIASNVFFIEHQHEHDFDEETKSFLNQHEAEYVVALCKYLLKQGYQRHQITILTFYSAQLHCIRRRMPKSEFDGVKVVAVDSYQGEENDIILLSLVRSTTEGNIGFLKEENRICVALSRAKVGMFVIGNFSHIVDHSDLLKEICERVNNQGKLGPALTLSCQRHPTDQRGAVDPEDFEAAPEGGCTKPCDYRLPCGHVCPKICHANNPEHKDYKCFKTCRKSCKNGHSNCRELCYKPCTPCEEPVQIKLPKCGHFQNVPCHLDPNRYQCKEKCFEILSCGHKCPGLCGAPHQSCSEPVETDLPCGHRSSVPCGQRITSHCNSPCGTTLKCGHVCQGTCGGCHQGRLHQPCTSKCTRILICGHECQSTCNNCPPCERQCETRCSHSSCKKKCGESCVTCKEPCDIKCRHSKCETICGSTCNRKRCNERCKKKLRCGHPCIGLCGEKCPPVCKVCHKSEIAEIHFLFGTEDKPSTRMIQLEDCGHIFEVTSLDKWMDEIIEEGNKTVVKLKECPKCQLAIRRSFRYANIIKRALADIEEVKLKMKGNERRVKELTEYREQQARQFTGEDRVIVQQLTQSDRVPSESVISAQTAQLRILHQITSIEGAVKRSSRESEKRYEILLKYIKDFKTWIMTPRCCFSQQEVTDSRRELTRLSLLRFSIDAKYHIEVDKKDVPENLMQKLCLLVHHLERPSVMPESDLHDAKELREEVKKYVPESQIGVSEEERLMIVEAVGLNRGHWFKCKEGHVYAIGECGRAYEEATCPECGGAIGGMSHQLSEDNAWAPEMDDAEEVPWSEEKDLEFAIKLYQELNG